MRRALSLTLLLAAIPCAAPQASAQQAQQRSPLRIMPIGDSITEGDRGGFRLPLFRLISEAMGRPNFVGRRNSRYADPEAFSENDHDGYGTYRIGDLASGDGLFGEGPEIEQRLDDWDPAIVLLHAGTNDFQSNYYLFGDDALGIPNVVERLESLVARIAVHAPHVHVIVAQIVPIHNNAENAAEVVAFNARIPALVARQQALGRRVTMVDMHTPLVPYPHPDGVHPSRAGYDVMARVWFEGIRALGPVQNPEPGRDDGVRQRDYFSTTATRPGVPSQNLLRLNGPALETVIHEGYDGTAPPSALHDGLAYFSTDDDDNTWTSTFVLDTDAHAAGYDLTQIRTASGGRGQRHRQAYEVWYATVNAPEAFVRLGDFHAVPVYLSQLSSALVIEGEEGAPLARGVKAVQFRFVRPPERQRGFFGVTNRTGYYEIEALGSPTPGASAPEATAPEATASAAGALPEQFALLPAAPNPFAGNTALRVALPESGPVRVAVYDALGRRVATLLDRTLEAGTHEVRLDAGALPGGLYFVRLDAGGRTLTQAVTRTR